MRQVILILAFLLSISSCKAQESANQKPYNTLATETNQPKENWKVNKQYDKNGNLIGYDSTYTWSYSSNGTIPASIDSAFASFSKRLQMRVGEFFGTPGELATGSEEKTNNEFEKQFDPYRLHMDMANMKHMMQTTDSLHRSFMNSFLGNIGHLHRGEGTQRKNTM